MASSPLRARRFLPEPVETSVRSSKRSDEVTDNVTTRPPITLPSDTSERPVEQANNMATQSKPRRFLPQPVEESTRSSRKQPSEQKHTNLEDGVPSYSDDPTLPGVPNSRPSPQEPRRFAPTPVETTTTSSRRKFVVEPVETSSRSSKDKPEDTRPRRRFAPQPVETSSRSSKDKEQQDTSAKTRRKFAPEPIETEMIRRRHKPSKKEDKHEYTSAEDGPAETENRDISPQSRTSSGSRKFSPELLETAKGAFRQSVVHSSIQAKKSKPSSPPPEEEAVDDVAPLVESNFSAAALARRQHEEKRKGSLMVPELPTIDSDSGDDSEAPSLTNSRSSAESEQRQNNRRALGDSYTDYVLRLAAQTSDDKALQEQAMAAYINERPHEPVAHFAFDDEDDATLRIGKLSIEKGDIKTFRRSSQDDLDWEMQNMRKHHAQLEEAKRQFKQDTAGQSRFSAAALATRHHLEAQKEQKTKKVKAGGDEQSELARMRAAASPPMLGSDLTFPFTISPKMTRCDTDHPPRPRTNDSDEEEDEDGDQIMWNAKMHINHDAPAGLWGGMCQAGQGREISSRPHTPTRSGIQTPAVDRGNPFEASTPGRGQRTPGRRKERTLLVLPPSQTQSQKDTEDAFTSTIDAKLLLERHIEDEFPDRVITQIYNYLSLGYPSLAWTFDDELSKISRISVEDLRKDDDNADAKGYVGVPEGIGTAEVDVTGGKCRRWEALRLYVREWARQSPGFIEGEKGAGGQRGWGGNAAVRKGSWGH